LPCNRRIIFLQIHLRPKRAFGEGPLLKIRLSEVTYN